MKSLVTAPTFDEIIILGPGNVAWSLEELRAISDEDLGSALETLGSITKWSRSQSMAILERLEEVKSLPLFILYAVILFCEFQ